MGLDEDEWEYEYHDTETEDFYFTLDLTTHVPDALAQKKQKADELEAEREIEQAEREIQQAEQEGTSATNGNTEDDNTPRGDAADQDQMPTAKQSAGRLQVLGLHSSRPLVKLDDRIYRCYWSTDLGTQIYVAKAGDISPVKRAGNVVDVIGSSQTRLLGGPVTLKRKRESENRNASAQS